MSRLSRKSENFDRQALYLSKCGLVIPSLAKCAASQMLHTNEKRENEILCFRQWTWGSSQCIAFHVVPKHALLDRCNDSFHSQSETTRSNSQTKPPQWEFCLHGANLYRTSLQGNDISIIFSSQLVGTYERNFIIHFVAYRQRAMKQFVQWFIYIWYDIWDACYW